MRTLVVGVGNAIRGDDGVGPLVAAEVCRRGGDRYESLAFCGSGLDLLGELATCHREHVVLIDSLDSGALEEGAVARLEIDAILAAPPRTPAHVSSHALGLLDALALACDLGVELPGRLSVYAVGIRPARGFRDGLGASLQGRVDAVATEILADLRGGGGGP